MPRWSLLAEKKSLFGMEQRLTWLHPKTLYSKNLSISEKAKVKNTCKTLEAFSLRPKSMSPIYKAGLNN